MNIPTRSSLFFLFLCLISPVFADDATKLFVASDGSIAITTGPTWTQSPDNGQGAVLNIVEAQSRQYISAQVVLRADYASDLSEFAQACAQRISNFKTLNEPVPQPQEIKINGRTAYQWEMHMTNTDNYRWAAVVTCVSTNRYFAVITASVLESKSKDLFPKLREMVATVHEVPDLFTNNTTRPALASTRPANHAVKVYAASDHSIEITADSTWKEYRVDAPTTTLHLIDASSRQYLQGYVVSRSDYASDLSGFAQKQAERFAESSPGATTSDPTEIQVNGNDAIQWEVHWTGPNKVRWAGIVTIIATHRYFAEVRAITHESSAGDLLPKLRDIVATVREVPDQTSEPGAPSTQPIP